MLANEKGLVGWAYILLILLSGILLLVVLLGRKYDYTGFCGKTNAGIEKILIARGIDKSNIKTDELKKQRSGISVWIERRREISVPKAVDLKKLAGELQEYAQKRGLTVSKSLYRGSSPVLDISLDKKRFFHIVFKSGSTQALQPIITRKFAMVIDDIGYISDISPYLGLGVPITFAIMPHERFSKKIALELMKINVPFIMHLPLEPESYPKVNPGKYALLTAMSKNEIEDMLDSDIASVPGIKGVSNHMGSKFSSDAEKMSILLDMLKKRNLFYFDSYTTPHSKAKKIAGEIGLPCKVNELFVDLEDTPEYMRGQFEKAEKMIERNGDCIAIGHIQRKSLLAALKEIIPEFKDKGIEFVYLEAFMRAKKNEY